MQLPYDATSIWRPRKWLTTRWKFVCGTGSFWKSVCHLSYPVFGIRDIVQCIWSGDVVCSSSLGVKNAGYVVCTLPQHVSAMFVPKWIDSTSPAICLKFGNAHISGETMWNPFCHGGLHNLLHYPVTGSHQLMQGDRDILTPHLLSGRIWHGIDMIR